MTDIPPSFLLSSLGRKHTQLLLERDRERGEERRQRIGENGSSAFLGGRERRLENMETSERREESMQRVCTSFTEGREREGRREGWKAAREKREELKREEIEEIRMCPRTEEGTDE